MKVVLFGLYSTSKSQLPPQKEIWLAEKAEIWNRDDCLQHPVHVRVLLRFYVTIVLDFGQNTSFIFKKSQKILFMSQFGVKIWNFSFKKAKASDLKNIKNTNFSHNFGNSGPI